MNDEDEESPGAAKEGHCYVRIEFIKTCKGVEIKFVVDTGETRTILTEEDCDKLKKTELKYKLAKTKTKFRPYGVKTKLEC